MWKNIYNQHGKRQRFSIRKYYFGAASIPLGMAIILGNGAMVKAELPTSTDVTAESLVIAAPVVVNSAVDNQNVVSATGSSIILGNAADLEFGKVGKAPTHWTGLTGNSRNNEDGGFTSMSAPAELKLVVKSNQRDTHDNSGVNQNVGGRQDYPVSGDISRKIQQEALFWKEKMRPNGTPIGSTLWGANGAYEFLATEIYDAVYEQGTDQVLISGFKARFDLSDDSKAAGWSIVGFEPTNLPAGLVYIEETDTIEGKVFSNIENGVQDLRAYVYVQKGTDIYRVFVRNLRAGWIGWKDETAPTISAPTKATTHVVGDVLEEGDKTIEYSDNGGAQFLGKGYEGTNPFPADGLYTFTASNGQEITVPRVARAQNARPTSGLAGAIGNNKVDAPTTITGITYNQRTGDLRGTFAEASNYTVTAFAKDYDVTSGGNERWKVSGQEAHAPLTLNVDPRSTVKNIETGDTAISVAISVGATSMVMTMPDGTTTTAAIKNGNWEVTGGTNTAVAVGTVLGAVATQPGTESSLTIPVTSVSAYAAGIDNITVTSFTENVKATIMREIVQLNGTDGVKHEARLNPVSGHWEFTDPAYATVDKTNPDGTRTLTKREVWTKIAADGGAEFAIYEYTRTYDANGNVTAVDTQRPLTNYVGDKSGGADSMYVTVSYSKETNTWKSSDGTAVTAKEDGEGWHFVTASGFEGRTASRKAEFKDFASIENSKPTASATDYTEFKDRQVDLLTDPRAQVAYSDQEDSRNRNPKLVTELTSIIVTAPDGSKVTYDSAKDEENTFIAATKVLAEKTAAMQQGTATIDEVNAAIADVETKREALKTAAATLKGEIQRLTLSQVGKYKVDITVVDSNGIVTNPVIGGTEAGSIVENAVASTTYYITVPDPVVTTSQESGTVWVSHILEDGTVLEDFAKEGEEVVNNIVTTDGVVATTATNVAYNITATKRSKFEKDGKLYEYVRTDGNMEDKYIVGRIDVTHVYREIKPVTTIENREVRTTCIISLFKL